MRTRPEASAGLPPPRRSPCREDPQSGSKGLPRRIEVTVDFLADDVAVKAGLLPVRKLDRELGILTEAAARSADPRSQIYVLHDAEELLFQQVYQLLGGYFDASDADVLRNNPLFQTLADHAPSPEQPLASGSKLSRVKYAYTPRQRNLPVEEQTIEQERQAAKCQRIRAMNQFLVETLIKTRRTPPNRISSRHLAAVRAA